MRKLISIEGSINDILIYGKSKSEHDATLEEILNMLQTCGLTANKDKCKISIECKVLRLNIQQ